MDRNAAALTQAMLGPRRQRHSVAVVGRVHGWAACGERHHMDVVAGRSEAGIAQRCGTNCPTNGEGPARQTTIVTNVAAAT
jgi:hypothetical protein